MIIHEFEIVVNVEFDGFRLDTEMAMWLVENKGWTITQDWEPTKEYDLIDCKGNYFQPTNKYKKIEFRMNPDLIECVKELQKKYKSMNFLERQKYGVCDLNVEVQDVHDGKEEVVVTSDEDDYDDFDD